MISRLKTWALALAKDLDFRIGASLFFGALITLFATEQSAGFTRDESVYFQAAESYARWFQAFWASPSNALSDSAIVAAYDTNHEHPALMKNLFGLSYLFLHEKLGWLRPAAAFRFPAFVFAALILPLTFAFGRRLFSRSAGVFAAISFLLVPRQFFEAHLSCFDVPIVTMWMWVVYCFFRALEEKRWWLITGVAFGLALGTKHNALFLPFVVMPFALFRAWKSSAGKPQARALGLQTAGVFVAGAVLYGVLVFLLGPQQFQAKFFLLSPHTALFALMAGAGFWRLHALFKADVDTARPLGALVAMAVLGPIIWYLHWPYLWHAPVDRTAWFLAFHATHNHYTWYYLGQMLREPPFPLEYVVVKTALTVPTSLFVPMVLGLFWVAARMVRRQATLLEWLVAFNAVASIAIISQPQVPHFGGVKHWFPSMPFLAVLAGGVLLRGADALSVALKPKLSTLTPQVAFLGLALLCGIPAAIATARVAPYGTSAYSELAGGLPGAATLGMQRQFWANNVTGVFEWINKNAKPGERVYLHEVHGLMIRDFQRNGMLRTDLSFTGDPYSAQLVAYQYHQEFRQTEFDTWQALGTFQPVTGLYVDETPQVIVYRR